MSPVPRRVRLASLFFVAVASLAMRARAQDANDTVDDDAAVSAPIRGDASGNAVLRRDPRSLPQAEAGHWSSRPLVPAPEHQGEFAAVQRALASRDVPAALAALFHLLELEADFPPAWHQIGVLYFRLQRYGDAAHAFERFLRQVPERVAETRALGHCYYSLGRYDAARAHYERVLERQPEMVEALRGLALSHLRLGDSKRALELLERVVELAPSHVDALTWIAQIRYDAEELEPALTAATHARDLDPSQPRPWFLIGRIQAELGHADESRAAQRRFELLQEAAQRIRTLEARLLVEPQDAAALEALVEAQRATGNVARTRGALARWSAARPGSRAIMVRALDVLDGLDDVEGARAVAEALAAKFPDEADVWRRLESFYARRGDRARQVEAGERARRLGGR